MTALGMILAGLGLTLVWCGIRDEDPRAVIAGVFTGHTVTNSSAPAAGAAGARAGAGL